MQLPNVLRNHALPSAIVLSLAILASQFSFRLRDLSWADTISVQLRILEGRADMPEFQNRILVPALTALAMKIAPAGFSDRSLWHILRFIEATAAYVALYVAVSHTTGSRLRALISVGLVTFAYLWTPMTDSGENPSDFFDIGFTALFVCLALAEKPFALMLVVVLASMNRESAAFAGIVWIAVTYMRHGARDLPKYLPALAYMIVSVSVVWALRYGLAREFHPRQLLGIVESLHRWRAYFHPTGVTPMIMATAVVYFAALRLMPRPWTADQKAMMGAAVVCALITAVFGIWTELRIWLPCWVMLSFTAVIGGNHLSDRDWLASLQQHK